MELQDEATWLRNRIARMRLAFRFATEPLVESILQSRMLKTGSWGFSGRLSPVSA
jgi:hypothetical protein